MYLTEAVSVSLSIRSYTCLFTSNRSYISFSISLPPYSLQFDGVGANLGPGALSVYLYLTEAVSVYLYPSQAIPVYSHRPETISVSPSASHPTHVLQLDGVGANLGPGALSVYLYLAEAVSVYLYLSEACTFTSNGSYSCVSPVISLPPYSLQLDGVGANHGLEAISVYLIEAVSVYLYPSEALPVY